MTKQHFTVGFMRQFDERLLNVPGRECVRGSCAQPCLHQVSDFPVEMFDASAATTL